MTNAGLEMQKKIISAEEKGEKPTGDPILLLKEKEFLGMMKPQPSSWDHWEFEKAARRGEFTCLPKEMIDIERRM